MTMHWGEHIRNIISGMFIYALISLIIPFFNPYISLFNYFFPKVDNYEISKRNQFDEIKKKIFSSRITEPISTKLVTKHSWVKEIQIYSNEGPRTSLMGDNYEMSKIHWWNSFKNFCRTTELISTKLGTNYP